MPPVSSTRSTRSSKAKPYNLRSASSPSSRTSSGSSASSVSAGFSEPSSPTSSSSSTSESGEAKLTRLHVTRIMAFLENELKRERSEFLEQKAQFLEEKEVLIREKRSAEAEVAALRQQRDTLVAARDETLTCSVCHQCMERPFTIVECHHSFCFSCLRGWWQTSISRQLRWRTVPEELRNPPYTAATINALFGGGFIHILLHTCPLCRGSVSERPVEIPLLRDLVQTISATHPPAAGVVPAHPQLEEADIWAGVFREVVVPVADELEDGF
ncbi:hypothetical protein BJ138DRAFT_1161518 [Hygrophoropsis aurantiaca]|uniref:Uncharacterized protein n=1 Tax=Hygrophoropsis aurantiaca TaxID=72124 RepID=A0ACB8A1I0_9AGAM|nr:hypothetical protein BJ138DRAFT_1161518 [Hygrophoropsis aurantiaca]